MNCTWYVDAPTPDEQVELDFSRFDLNSDEDLLQIFDLDPTVPVASYTGADVPPSFRSRGQYVDVRLITGPTTTATGFEIVTKSSSRQCGIGHRVAIGDTFTDGSAAGETYEPDLECTWLLESDPSDPDTWLIFDRLNLRPPCPECGSDVIEVYEAGSLDDLPSEPDATYSGFDIPVPYTATSRYILIRLITGPFVFGGFQISTSVGEPVHRSHTVDTGASFTDGTVEQQSYSANVDSTWLIVAKPGSRVELEWNRFDIAAGSADFVELYDADTMEGNEPAIRYTSEDSPPVFQSRGRYMIVRFVASDSAGAEGFEATTRSVATQCGRGHIVPLGQSFTDGSPVDGSYAGSLDCTWRIWGVVGRRVTLSFDQFNLRWTDELQIYASGEIDSASEPVVTYSGSDSPSSFRASTNEITVRFTTGSGNPSSSTGFTISTEDVSPLPFVVAGNSFTDGSPASEPYAGGNRDGAWLVRSADGEQCELEFKRFDLGGDDFVELYDADTLEGNEPVVRYMGNQLPPMFRSRGDSVVVRFVTVESSGYGGFEIDTKAVSGQCGRGHIVRLGDFFSDGSLEDEPYEGSLFCTWLVLGGGDEDRVHLGYNRFSLSCDEDDVNCDFVEIYDAADAASASTLVGRYSRDTIPPPFWSSANVAFVVFQTVLPSGSPAGFEITSNRNRSQHMVAPGDSFTDGSPEGEPYRSDVRARWTIQADAGNQIELDIDRWDLGGDDTITIYDIETMGEPVLTYPGLVTPSKYRSYGSVVVVDFDARNSSGHAGFKMATSSSSSQCGEGHVVHLGDEFTDGSAPSSSYARHLDCTWLIVGSATENVHLSFDRFDLRQGGGNLVRVYDAHSAASGKLIGEYSGGDVPPRLRAIANVVFVEFDTDGTFGSASGFEAKTGPDPIDLPSHVTVTAGGKFTDGTVAEADFDSNLERTWLIEASSGSQVVLEFTRFDVAADDVVAIYDGDSSDGSPVLRHSGQDIPPRFRSRGRYALVLFQTTSSSEGHTGFEIETSESSSQCGRDHAIALDDTFDDGSPAGSRYSTGSNALDCTWRIVAGDGETIHLEFNRFALQCSSSFLSNCDVLEVYEGDSIEDDEALVGRFSGTIPPAAMKLLGQVATVRFKTNTFSAMAGFEIATRSEFSHTLPASAGRGFTSAGRPGLAYDADMDQYWLVEADEGNQVELAFTSFDLGPGGDYVELYEGDSAEASALVASHSGQTIPRGYRSFGNQVLVHLESVDGEGHPGFELVSNSSDTQCGRNHSLRAGQSFSDGSAASEFFGRPSGGLDCTWLIESEPNEYIHIDFTRFDMWRSSSIEYVEIFGNASLHGQPYLYRFRGSYSSNDDMPVARNIPGPYALVHFRARPSGASYYGFHAVTSSSDSRAEDPDAESDSGDEGDDDVGVVDDDEGGGGSGSARSPGDDSGSLSAGAIGGIVVSLIVVVGIGVVFFLSRRGSSSSAPTANRHGASSGRTSPSRARRIQSANNGDSVPDAAGASRAMPFGEGIQMQSREDRSWHHNPTWETGTMSEPGIQVGGGRGVALSGGASEQHTEPVGGPGVQL